MEVIAKSKSVKISPRKVRLVSELVRNKSVEKALEVLIVTRKRASLAIAKTIKSALANAINNVKLQKENLFISRIEISDGTAIKRFHPSTRGRTHPYKKRTSHITVVLKEANGTKS
ncbi:MAG: 50S ribosomal protein L22 [bacterium]|nr:50S ribosomal protein L22 [bacterium]